MDTWAAIGVALIGAAAGLGGAFLGSQIAARATLQAAEQQREEARVARFADRIRELGDLVLDSTYRFTEAVNEGDEGANLGRTVPHQVRELRLVVRLDGTGLVLDELLGCLTLLDYIRPGGGDHTPNMVGQQIQRSRELQERTEDALRAELGLGPAPREDMGF